MKMNFYNKLTSRNYLYIKPELQNKIKNARIAFLGSGLSSIAAEYAVRTGFSDLTICDGDNVEISNLNRQAFSINEIGRNKAYSLKKRLLEINPDTSIDINCRYINSIDDVEDEIKRSNIIINTIDCNKIYFDIIEYSRGLKKLVICPFNPGFGGIVCCFNQSSASAYEAFECSQPIDDIEIAKRILNKFPDICANLNISKTQFIDAVENKKYFPQLMIGGAIASSLTISSMIKHLNHEPFPLAPSFHYLTCNSE